MPDPSRTAELTFLSASGVLSISPSPMSAAVILILPLRYSFSASPFTPVTSFFSAPSSISCSFWRSVVEMSHFSSYLSTFSSNPPLTFSIKWSSPGFVKTSTKNHLFFLIFIPDSIYLVISNRWAINNDIPRIIGSYGDRPRSADLSRRPDFAILN